MSEYVLDASALIALVHGEPGADEVRPLMAHAVISAVNLCGTVQRLRRGGMPLEAGPLQESSSPSFRKPVPRAHYEPQGNLPGSLAPGIPVPSG